MLLASENDVDGYRQSGVARDLNRAHIEVEQLEAMMANPQSRAARATSAILTMLRTRATSDAFDPAARQIVSRQGSVVVVERVGRTRTARVLLNVSTEDATIDSVHVPALQSVWMV